MTPSLYRSPNIAPAPLQGPSVFLAGSIDMGLAELWQPRLTRRFLEAGVHVFDPRRTDWDSSWPQDPTPGTPFHQQVTWELDHLETADAVYMRLCDTGPAIVSMLELGLLLGTRKPLIIQADPGYMRRGNVIITAQRYGAAVFDREDDAFACARAILASRHQP